MFQKYLSNWIFWLKIFKQEDLLIHGDSVYDIIDKQDHQSVQNEMGRPPVVGSSSADDARIFLCRMNVSRNARRQMRFGDQKVINKHELMYYYLIMQVSFINSTLYNTAHALRHSSVNHLFHWLDRFL